MPRPRANQRRQGDHSSVGIHSRSDVLYDTAGHCHAKVEPGHEVFRGHPAEGIVREIPENADLDVLGEDVAKDSICYEVEVAGTRGYVLGSDLTSLHEGAR